MRRRGNTLGVGEQGWVEAKEEILVGERGTTGALSSQARPNLCNVRFFVYSRAKTFVEASLFALTMPYHALAATGLTSSSPSYSFSVSSISLSLSLLPPLHLLFFTFFFLLSTPNSVFLLLSSSSSFIFDLFHAPLVFCYTIIAFTLRRRCPFVLSRRSKPGQQSFRFSTFFMSGCCCFFFNLFSFVLSFPYS